MSKDISDDQILSVINALKAIRDKVNKTGKVSVTDEFKKAGAPNKDVAFAVLKTEKIIYKKGNRLEFMPAIPIGSDVARQIIRACRDYCAEKYGTPQKPKEREEAGLTPVTERGAEFMQLSDLTKFPLPAALPKLTMASGPIINTLEDSQLIHELKRRGYTGTLTKKIEL